ncbi:Myb/SANT-like domain [Thalictrum thalictroides]|uniref:Myb/SANT-like domain n=2 Tax=Thalictrum thalictroides TaxID=46969 RepID=A0A7J6WIP3_THATH|nr:Myb/SANT-like domain [Thalictrum thalictroides]
MDPNEFAQRIDKGKKPDMDFAQMADMKKKQVNWTRSMDNALIDTFLDAYQQGKKQGRVWDESVYVSIKSAVLAKCHEHVEKNHIVSRVRTMRTEFNCFMDLKSRSGFGWDPIKQTIDAPDEKWDELLGDPKSREKFKGFRDRGPKWPLEQLAIIVGNTYATGSNSFGGLDTIDLNKMASMPDLPNNETIDVDDVEDTNGAGKRKGSASTSKKRQHGKKTRLMDGVSDVVHEMTDEMVNLRKSIDPAARAEYVREQVLEVEGFSKPYLRKAYVLIMRDPIEKEIFIGGDSEIRKDIVENLRAKIENV